MTRRRVAGLGGSFEREVLMRLAAAGRSAHRRRGPGRDRRFLAYTTVMTTLVETARKARLRTPRCRAAPTDTPWWVGPKGAQSNMTAHQMLQLLDDESDRVGVLTRFVAELTPEDEKLLTDLLEWATTHRRLPKSPGQRRDLVGISAPRSLIAPALALTGRRLARQNAGRAHGRSTSHRRCRCRSRLCTGLVLSATAGFGLRSTGVQLPSLAAGRRTRPCAVDGISDRCGRFILCRSSPLSDWRGQPPAPASVQCCMVPGGRCTASFRRSAIWS